MATDSQGSRAVGQHMDQTDNADPNHCAAVVEGASDRLEGPGVYVGFGYWCQ